MTAALSQTKKMKKIVPCLSLPIWIADRIADWYVKEKSIFTKISKYPLYLLTHLLVIASIPFHMLGDFAIGSFSAILALFHRTQRVALKQIAWNCLICGTIGGPTVILQGTKRILIPERKHLD